MARQYRCISLVESGLGGTGGIGSEIIEITLAETGVSGTGATGDATDVLTNLRMGRKRIRYRRMG